jgi:hypothetical protein
MEASNKDLARARFKQQRRDAFRDGRGRGGRGRGRGRSGPFDDVDADEDEAPETTRGDERNAPRPEIDLPPDEDDERVDADGNVRPRSKGADLGALFAECDQAALPRQHASAYLDPSWAVDDLAALERVALGGGPGNRLNTYGELSPRPRGVGAAAARAPARGPARALGGLPRVRGGPAVRGPGGTDDPAPAATVAGDDGAAAVADRASGPQAEVDHLPTANAGGGGDTGDTGAVARSGAGASGEKETRRGHEDGDDDAELDALLDGRDGSAGEESRRERRKHAGPPVPAATTSRDEDDAFLDQLLG